MEPPKKSPPPLDLKAMAQVSAPTEPKAAPKPLTTAEEFFAEPIDKTPAKSGSITSKIELVIFMLLLLVSFVFGLQNSQTVNVKFFSYIANFPLGVAMLIAAAVGGVLVGLMWGYWAIKKRLQG